MPGFSLPDACNGGGDGGGGVSNTTESVRHHRYSFSVQGLPAFTYIYSIEQPTPSFEMVTFHQGQDEIHRPGKTKYEPITIVIYDVINSSGKCSSRESIRWWANTLDGTLSSLRGSGYKRNASIKLEDGSGGTVWEYNLLNSWPLKVQLDRLSHDDTEIGRVTVVLAFDKLAAKK